MEPARLDSRSNFRRAQIPDAANTHTYTYMQNTLEVSEEGEKLGERKRERKVKKEKKTEEIERVRERERKRENIHVRKKGKIKEKKIHGGDNREAYDGSQNGRNRNSPSKQDIAKAIVNVTRAVTTTTISVKSNNVLVVAANGSVYRTCARLAPR